MWLWCALACMAALGCLASLFLRYRRHKLAVVDACLKAERASHGGNATAAAPDDALAALRPLLGNSTVRVEQALRSQCGGRTKHVARLAADVRRLRCALRLLCGDEVGETDGVLCGRGEGAVWILRELDETECVLVHVSSDGPVWTPLLRDEAFKACRGPVNAEGALPMRVDAPLPDKFDRAAHFFSKGERLADPNVERWVVTERSDTHLTVFTQFYGLWPIVGPRHQTVRYAIERRGAQELVMRGVSVPDGEIPSAKSVAMEKTATMRLAYDTPSRLRITVVEVVNAKLGMKLIPDWVCLVLAKKLRERLRLVAAHLDDTPPPTLGAL